MPSFVRPALAGLAALAAISAASAETPGPEAAPPAQAAGLPETEVLGPWRLICGQQKEEGCVARQTILLEKGPPETSLDLFLTPGPDRLASLSLVTSLDVMIRPGAGIARSGRTVTAPVWWAEFAACGREGCQASAFFDPESVYGAEDPVAVLVSPEGQQLVVPLDLSRLRDAIDRTRPQAK